MKIIVFEGLDKSGKATQANLLFQRLVADKQRVATLAFHHYASPTGKLIRAYLDGKYNVNDRAIELIMAADKQVQQKHFQILEDDGYDFLILDRYITSQLVYAAAKNLPSSWISGLLSGCKKPDIEFLLDIPAEESMQRKGKHGANDRYESDLELLSKVRKLYKSYFSMYPIGPSIDGMMPTEEIHETIYKHIREEWPA
ncbi:dTMP kinase [Brevibacillus centrosporus]|uniref:dTMP kinase n=1 Tax=Brevibacillus centrosporus TaxID=54910 RepID=UPI002E1BC2B6|nr:dTMP kinase [Brevibacillus centrosporus]MED1954858.1 dTMP kinase [Brevibacillus centrosporus]